MGRDEKLKYDIDLDEIKDPKYLKWRGDYDGALAQMQQRTRRHELYGLIAKNKSIHDWLSGKGGGGKYFSEGSTQYILRKSLASTIQRVPDGELNTQYDKASIEHIITEYIFENKVLWSEFEGLDMLSNITDTFKMSFIYGFCPVRTGFEKDSDGDVRISYCIENWADIAVNQDCRDIRRPQTVWHRSYMSKADVEALLTEDGTVKDPSYEERTIKYVIDHQMFGAKQWESEKLADKLKGSTSLASLELLTRYDRGAKEFVTYVPAIGAVFRRVRNEDPRRGIPWNMFVLETDPDFPFGLSQVEFLLADQQFQDLFQTSAYKNLLLAMEPPIMVAGWETNPASYRFEPRKIWNLGNNPNQAKVDPVKIDNAVLSSFLQTREGVAAGMLRQLNVLDGTVAKDSHVPGFSATPQGVEMQERTKEISVNQYQKRIEYFIADWANQALRMYINAMGGVHKLTVDEKTRRRLFDIGRMDLIDGNKIEVDFDSLGTDLLEFKVRTGSLTQKKEDQERKALQETVQPITQNLNGWSEQNKAVVENEILLPALKRLLELSDTDIGQTLAESIGTHMAKMAMAELQGQIDNQQAQLDEQGAMLEGIQGALPPEAQAQLAQDQMPVAQDEGVPAPASPLMGTGMGETSPSRPPMPPLPETAGQEVFDPAELLSL
jgi:Fe2+ transport system protein FeoA